MPYLRHVVNMTTFSGGTGARYARIYPLFGVYIKNAFGIRRIVQLDVYSMSSCIGRSGASASTIIVQCHQNIRTAATCVRPGVPIQDGHWIAVQGENSTGSAAWSEGGAWGDTSFLDNVIVRHRLPAAASRVSSLPANPPLSGAGGAAKFEARRGTR